MGPYTRSRTARARRSASVASSHRFCLTRLRPSIVNGQIAAASRGAFGNVQFTTRTAGSTLFVNPLMAIYFTVRLDALAARCLYLDRIEDTVGMLQVNGRIAKFRTEITPRIPKAYPH